MNEFIMISLNCNPFVSQELDLRVPTHLTLKELLQIVSEAYNLGFELINPSARDHQTGQILTSTSRLELLKDGVLLQLETL